MSDTFDRIAFDKFQTQVNDYLRSVVGTAAYLHCPLCGQGALIRAEVLDTAEQIMFCDECDSVWKVGQPIDETNAEAFMTFRNAHGKIGFDFTELRIV